MIHSPDLPFPQIPTKKRARKGPVQMVLMRSGVKKVSIVLILTSG
jgi:hypothetical protein